MHILASGSHRIMSAFRSLVFLCAIHHLANTYVHFYPTKSGLGEDGVRIERLRMITKRLTHDHGHPLVEDQSLTTETLACVNPLTEGIGTTQNTADKLFDTGNLHYSISPYIKQSRLKRVYRQDSGRPLENFRNTYTDLYNALPPFLNQYIQHLKPSANRVLLNAVLIPSVLRPNDPSFSKGDTKNLMKKFSLVEQALQALLNYGQEFAQDGYKPIFTPQARVIEYKLSTAAFATVSLPFYKDPTNVTLMSCGPFCVTLVQNTGIKADTIFKLYSMANFLVNKVVPTPT